MPNAERLLYSVQHEVARLLRFFKLSEHIDGIFEDFGYIFDLELI